MKQFLSNAEAKQECTHIATPQENAYRQAFHRIVQREVIDRFEFASFYEAKSTLSKHRAWYNHQRKHGQLKQLTPAQKWNQYQNANFTPSGKAEVSHAGVQLTRNSLMNGDNPIGADVNPAPLSPKLSLFPMPHKTQSEKEQIDLNSFNGSLQFIGG